MDTKNAKTKSRNPIVWIVGGAIAGALLLNFQYGSTQDAPAIRTDYEVLAEQAEDQRSPVATQISLAPNTVHIPKIGVTSPIVYVAEKSEQRFRDAMNRGVGHYPGTARAGDRGNMYLFGHSAGPSWRGSNPYLAIFSRIPSLNVGDSVFVSNERGRVFEYRVYESFPVNPNDLWVLDQGNGQRLLTLQTSWPLGMSLQRFIVRARLVE